MSFQGSSSTTGTTTTTGNETVTVDILGHRLSLKSDKDPKHVQDLARYINEKARNIQSAAPKVGIEKLMMLVSMMVAEELYEAKRESDTLRTALQVKVDAALAMLDEIDDTTEA